MSLLLTLTPITSIYGHTSFPGLFVLLTRKDNLLNVTIVVFKCGQDNGK